MRNFYEHQERALARTAKLLGWLGVGIGGTVACTSLVLTYAVMLLLASVTHLELHSIRLQLAEIFLVLCTVSGLFVAVSSLLKMHHLKAGGKVIAEELGGERIDPQSADLDQRRALHVVEEMAIAAGIPAPAVYVLEGQQGINAFAAGLTVDDAVIGVTRGCIRRLSRDQLQGVIAHEFSHIFNGDMRINLRLVGILHGILSITLLAEGLLRSAAEMMANTSRRRDEGDETLAVIVCLLLGVLLWPIGLIGALFGMLVMSATSRQREFLADAYAVQFTRNPEGLANALKSLAGHEAGSRVRVRNSLEVSHFFFAEGCRRLGGLLATHPPLAERIRRLDPNWDGVPMFEADADLDPYHGAYGHSLSLLTGDVSQGSLASLRTSDDFQIDNASLPRESESDEDRFGQSDWTRRYREQIQQDLAGAWLELLDDHDGCAAALIALTTTLLDLPESSLDAVDEKLRPVVSELLPHLAGWDAARQTLYFDLAWERLAEVPRAESAGLRQTLRLLLDQTSRGELAQWSWSRQLRHHLGLCSVTECRPRYGKLTEVQPACEAILSLLCHVGSDSAAMADYAFQRAVVHLGLDQPQIWDRDEVTWEALDIALDEIAEAAPRARREFLIAVGCCIAADQGITTEEVNLVRGINASLGLPIPQLLPGQSVVPGA